MSERMDLDRLLRAHFGEVADTSAGEGDLDRVLGRTTRIGQRGATWAALRLDGPGAVVTHPAPALAMLLLVGALLLLVGGLLLSGTQPDEVDLPAPSGPLPSASLLAVPSPTASLAENTPVPSSSPEPSTEPSASPPDAILLVGEHRPKTTACTWSTLDAVDPVEHVVRDAAGCAAVWSPDGTEIATWSPTGDFRGEVLIVSPEGTVLRRITSPAGLSLEPVAWSPDGRTLAFVGEAHGTAEELYVARASDGGGLTHLTAGQDRALAFSPDGRRLLIVRSFTIGAEVGVVDLDGGRYHGLASIPAGLGTRLRSAAWSPDGTRIAVAATFHEPGDPGLVPTVIEVIPAVGGDPEVIATADAARDITWSPAGRSIVYDADQGTNRILHLVKVDRACRCAGPAMVDRAGLPVAGFDPTWSPDGNWIAYRGGDGVELIRPDGSGRRVVVEGAGATPLGIPPGGPLPDGGLLLWRP